MKNFILALRLFFILAVLTGLLYPCFITLIGKILFPYKANGSLIHNSKGEIIGSELIAQKFESAKYFWPRPSASDFQTDPSGASNFGPTSKELREIIAARKETLLKDSNFPDGTTVPDDLLFASGSGLDPHISPEAAFFQMKRIAYYRGFNEAKLDKLKELVQENIEYPQYGFLGELRVNVLLLNLMLDKIK